MPPTTTCTPSSGRPRAIASLLVALVLVACRSGGPESKVAESPTSASELRPFLLDRHGGGWSLMLPTGDNPVDRVVAQLGHEPNGPFWEGVAQTLAKDDVSLLDGCEFDSEAGTFVVYARDRGVLERLARAMRPSVVDEARLRATMAAAEKAGVAFDD